MRGAPAIGVTGALALAVHLISGGRGSQFTSVEACLQDIGDTMDYLVTRSVFWCCLRGLQQLFGGIAKTHRQQLANCAQQPSLPHFVSFLLFFTAAAPLLSTCLTQPSSSRQWRQQQQHSQAPLPHQSPAQSLRRLRPHCSRTLTLTRCGRLYRRSSRHTACGFVDGWGHIILVLFSTAAKSSSGAPFLQHSPSTLVCVSLLLLPTLSARRPLALLVLLRCCQRWLLVAVRMRAQVAR